MVCLIQLICLIAAPVIVVGPSDETRLEGDVAVFVCLAEAEPLHNVTWYFQDSDVLLSGSRYTIEPSNDPHYGQLTVSKVTEADTGMYTCLVSNVYGNDSASAYLAVQGWYHMINWVISDAFTYNMLVPSLCSDPCLYH